MGHSEKILIFVIVSVGFVRGQSLDSSISDDVTELTTLNPAEHRGTMLPDDTAGLSTSTQSLSSTDKIQNSVRILDFIELTEEKHEAEFILDLIEEFPHKYNKTMISSGLLDSKLLKFRQVETLQDNTLPGKSGLKKIRKLKATVSCKMFYSLYPYDLAICTFLLFPGGGPVGSWESSNSSSLTPHTQLCSGGMDAYEFHVKGYLPVVIPGGNTTGVDMLTISLLLQRTSSTQVISQMYSPMLTLLMISFLTLSKGNYLFRIGISSACLIGMIITSTLCWWFIPREKDGQTWTEHYFVFCIGFVFQVVLTNIMMYRYLLKNDENAVADDSPDVEADRNKSVTNGTENGTTTTDTKSKAKLKISQKEMHILKMGKFHQYIYFKCLRPASWQLPVFFLIFNLIFWPALLYISGGLPAGFMPVPEAQTELDKLCL